MSKTNTGLVDHIKMALHQNWGYCLGTFGNILTAALLEQKCAQGNGVGTYNTMNKAYISGFMGKRVTDCYGLVKSYLWWNDGNVKYVAVQDRNQEMAYNAAKEKGPIASIPEIPGVILWMPGHAGIYIGDGEFIECAGAPVGMRKGRIENGKVVAGSKFTHWFKDTNIEYLEAVKEEEADVLKLDKEWQWEQLVKQLQELRDGGIITSDEWIMKAKEKRLTVSELAFVNNTVLGRIALK